MYQVYSTCSLMFIFYYSTQDQSTALHYACGGGHHDTVRVLLERGADPNTCDKVSGVQINMYMVPLKREQMFYVCGIIILVDRVTIIELDKSGAKSMYEFLTVVLFVQ